MCPEGSEGSGGGTICTSKILFEWSIHCGFHNKWCFSLNADINECNEGTDDCDMNADCNDTDGSFTCTCREGYSGNGTFCSSKMPLVQSYSLYIA